MSVRHAALFTLAALALVVPISATAKEFEPGDLRICNAKRCVAITNRPALAALGAFYYMSAKPPLLTPRVQLGAPSFQLRFDNDYVTGIVAAAKLDRFLSYGVNTGRFDAGRWYRVPSSAARELRRLTAGLSPLRVTQAALAKSR